MRSFIESVVALIALVILSPLLLIVSLAIALGSPGSPFYLAPRIGKGGKPFRMLKFRTMIRGAASRGPSITGRNDPRITRLGAILRMTKLDELPQFFNVLTGDMSLVGPRPEAPDMVALYTAEQRSVLSVKPGITGPSQLASGEESESIPENVKADEYYARHIMESKLQFDLDYIDQRSVLNDMRILFKTALYILQCCGRRIAMAVSFQRSNIRNT
jgi:lipopolysaccharide/colanic/teichoic acid biosynthesis glycosyltransferase